MVVQLDDQQSPRPLGYVLDVDVGTVFAGVRAAAEASCCHGPRLSGKPCPHVMMDVCREPVAMLQASSFGGLELVDDVEHLACKFGLLVGLLESRTDGSRMFSSGGARAMRASRAHGPKFNVRRPVFGSLRFRDDAQCECGSTLVLCEFYHLYCLQISCINQSTRFSRVVDVVSTQDKLLGSEVCKNGFVLDFRFSQSHTLRSMKLFFLSFFHHFSHRFCIFVSPPSGRARIKDGGKRNEEKK